MIRNIGQRKLTPDFCKMLYKIGLKYGLRPYIASEFKELKNLLTLNQN